MVPYWPAVNRPRGRLYPRGSALQGLPRAERHRQLSPNHHCVDLQAARSSIFAHCWNPPDPTWHEIMNDPVAGRRIVANWAGLQPEQRTVAHRKTKAGQPAEKWLYRVMLYAITAQLADMLRAQSGVLDPRLAAFHGALQRGAKRWLLGLGREPSAGALHTELEALETRIVMAFLRAIGEEYGNLSQVLLGDGFYVEHMVSIQQLRQMGADACQRAGFPRCQFGIEPATSDPPWVAFHMDPPRVRGQAIKHARKWKRLQLRTGLTPRLPPDRILARAPKRPRLV